MNDPSIIETQESLACPYISFKSPQMQHVSPCSLDLTPQQVIGGLVSTDGELRWHNSSFSDEATSPTDSHSHSINYDLESCVGAAETNSRLTHTSCFLVIVIYLCVNITLWTHCKLYCVGLRAQWVRVWPVAPAKFSPQLGGKGDTFYVTLKVASLILKLRLVWLHPGDFCSNFHLISHCVLSTLHGQQQGVTHRKITHQGMTSDWRGSSSASCLCANLQQEKAVKESV